MTLVLNYAEGSVYLESDMTDQEIITMAGEYGAWLNGTEIVFTDRGFVEFARALGKAEKQDVDWEAVAADQAMTIEMLKQREWDDISNAELNYMVSLHDSWVEYGRSVADTLKRRNT